MRLLTPGLLRLTVSASLLVTALFCGCGCGTTGMTSRTGLFGLRLGADSATALHILNQPSDILTSLPYISGKRILHDTVALTPCDLAFIRSFGFDSTGHLTVIGMTHKSANSSLTKDRDCGMKWLSDQFGPPAEEFLRDSIKVSAWNVAGSKLTLEAKSYDDNFGFVMIYLYGESPSMTSVR